MTERFMELGPAVERWIPPGSFVAVGGMHMTAAPMSLVRELVRREVHIHRLLTSPSASLQADLLIGAGLVSEIVSPYVGFEHLGLAPCFRRAVEGGELRVLECDEGSITHALHAGAGGLPFIPCPPGVDLTDIPAMNPELYARAMDPFTGEEGWAVRALRPDVMLLACHEADEDGNVTLDRFPFTDRVMALASKRLLVQVERVVQTAQIAVRSPGMSIPGFLVSAVVVTPGGCHPTASPGGYEADEGWLREYLQVARDPEAFGEYLARTVVDVPEAAYLELVASRRAAADGATR